MGERAEPAIEALIADFYAAFDNREGRQPSAEALRAMFDETATITRVGPNGADTWTPEAFISPRVAMLTDGTLTDFHEWEAGAHTRTLANIASRWSRYEKSGVLNGADYRGGGQKFIQMRRAGEGWLITSVLWEDD
ncbi:MAG: DUF4440 domain-containing protein [Proteobacteria bacterium]|nr:DUF4440 domain-containing protein [Pseudomonadota bacterium]